MARPRLRDSSAYYTVAQAAAVMGLCQDTVYRMVADGRLMCAHFGRAIRIPRRAVDPPTTLADPRFAAELGQRGLINGPIQRREVA